MASSEVMDTDALIAAVHDRSPIWDKSDKLHANRHVIATLWRDISEELDCDEIALRKRWKYIREKFASEYSKRGRSDEPGDCFLPSKWPYFQQLLFLKDFVQKRNSSYSYPIPSTTTTQQLVSPSDFDLDDMKNNDSTTQGSEDLDEANTTTQSEEGSEEAPQRSRETRTIGNYTFPKGGGPPFELPLSSKRKRLSQEDEYFQKIMCNIEEMKLEYMYLLDKQAQSKTEDEDEDLMFLKSLLPHIKKIPQHNKLRFQSSIQSVVEDFAYNHQNDKMPS